MNKKIVIAILIGILILARFQNLKKHYREGETVKLNATVLYDVLSRPKYQYLKVDGLQVYLPPFPRVSYGDRIYVVGEINKGKLRAGEFKIISKKDGILAGFRKKVIGFYQNTLPEPSAGLVSGIVFGDKSALDPEFLKSANATGVSHVVVASGTNVTFVSSFLISFLAVMLPRKKLIPYVILGIFLYVIICGIQAPLVRAAAMLTITLVAQYTGNMISVKKALLAVFAGMLLFNPLWIEDYGFILSFASYTSILLLEKRIGIVLRRLPAFLRDTIAITLAAQVGVTPIIIFAFGRFNPFSVIVNTLVVWTVPFVMLFGFLGGITGLAVPVLGKIMLYLIYPFTKWFLFVNEVFSG